MFFLQKVKQSLVVLYSQLFLESIDSTWCLPFSNQRASMTTTSQLSHELDWMPLAETIDFRLRVTMSASSEWQTMMRKL
jgi:hypothetical protein